MLLIDLMSLYRKISIIIYFSSIFLPDLFDYSAESHIEKHYESESGRMIKIHVDNGWYTYSQTRPNIGCVKKRNGCSVIISLVNDTEAKYCFAKAASSLVGIDSYYIYLYFTKRKSRDKICVYDDEKQAMISEI